MSNVRSYTDKQILDRVKSLESFEYIPKGYWCIGVQSNEDAFNEYDDKFYLFKGESFIRVMSGTTNAGKNALKGYDKKGLVGAAVLKMDIIYYDLYSPGKHRGRMEAWRQVKPMFYYRDSDKDNKAEQQGKLYHSIIYANFHTNNYDKKNVTIRKLIGGWSWACQVVNDQKKYYQTMDDTKSQKFISYAILKEWEV